MTFPKLGAPGIYRLEDEPIRALTGVRMDVCAFVGVAPRGPARVPVFRAHWADAPCGTVHGGSPKSLRSVAVAVESFEEYRRLYGGFEGPGLLPYAVAAYFENGGRRAYIVRIVHEYGDARDDEGTATGEVPGLRDVNGNPLRLRARNEGSWGNALSAYATFRATPALFESATTTQLELPIDSPIVAGTLLRLTLPDATRELRFVTTIVEEWRPDEGRRVRRGILETALPDVPTSSEIVEAELRVSDGDGREEIHARLGLAPEHPRWLAAVLYRESSLLYPDPVWIDGALTIDDVTLAPPPRPSVGQFTGGLDRFEDITPEDFFDDGWVPGDECPGSGVHALVDIEEIASVVVPDLYSPGPLAPVESITDPAPTAGPEFEPCLVAPPTPPASLPVPELDGLRLDPEVPADLETIIAYQSRLVSLAETLRSFVVLLDVPPRLTQQRMLAWRGRFGSDFAAAYHPWLVVSRREDRRDALIRINPSAVAAGIIARREAASGVPYGPANELAAGVVDVDDVVLPARHGVLHQANINVFVRERDGIRLTAARTLSRGRDFRQLSVRRLTTMIVRALEQQMQWTVFEPNNAALRADVEHMVTGFLRRLYRANAFRGATEEVAFFVRCDDELNPPRIADAGRLVTEIGIAPAEPLEFIVLRIAREGDGSLRLEA